MRLWVGRRQEPILGYVPKNDEKKNLGGLMLTLYRMLFIRYSSFYKSWEVLEYK